MALRVGQLGRLRSASRSLNADEQKTQTATLVQGLQLDSNALGVDHIRGLSSRAESLVQVFLTDHAAKDIFRHANGFEIWLKCLNNCGLFVQDHDHRLASSVTNLICNLLQVLEESFRDHKGNDRYFRNHLSGWQRLEEILDSLHSQIAPQGSDEGGGYEGIELLYQAIFRLALEQSKSYENYTAEVTGGHSSLFAQGSAPESTVIHHAQPLAMLIRMAIGKLGSSHALPQSSLTETYIDAICILVASKMRNAVSLWQTGILTDLLKFLCQRSGGSQASGQILRLAESLISLGVNELNDLTMIFGAASESEPIMTFLLKAVKNSRNPSFLQFDMSWCGYSAVEYPRLWRSFPPSIGYSLAAWIRIDEFDSKCHTTLFGAFDETQKCFILLYLEQDSHQLILQTSISAPIPSVRFKTMRFKPERWYHLAVVHRRNLSDSSQSVASLFVDGDFREHRKCIYPEAPPNGSEMQSTNGQPASKPHRAPPVQAFFGTPQKLATRTASHQIQSRWSLSGAHLYAIALGDEFLAVQYRLGPRYHGNYQDCLGPLLTYRASSELNLRNDQMHPDKTEKSDIVTVTEGKGSDLVNEDSILLGLDAANVIEFDARSSLGQGTVHELDHAGYVRYRMLSQKAEAIALNTAIVPVNEAISRSYGTGLLVGRPVVVNIKSLDDAVWSLSGPMPILFRLLERTTTAAAFLQGVEIMFECVTDNWRISEAMEKGDGFGILALLIREKLGIEVALAADATQRRNLPLLSLEDRRRLPLPLLQLILKFVGHDFERSHESLLINPMAYRVLLVDFDTWRRCDMETQTLYWKQFTDFVLENKNHIFNQKRLTRMRIVKKLIEALKTEDVMDDAASLIMISIKALLETSTGNTLYRDLAQFVVFALHDERAMPLSSMRHLTNVVSLRQKASSWARSARLSRPISPGGVQTSPGKMGLSRLELGVLVLRLLTDVVCNDTTGSSLRRLMRAVPNKWLLYLLAESDVRVVELTLNMIARSLLVSDFKRSFVDTHHGFLALKYRLKSVWQAPAAWTICFAILFGRTVQLARLADEFTVFTMIDVLQVDETLSVAQGDMLSVLFAMLESGLRHVARSDKTNETDARIIKTVVQFLGECHQRSQGFRDYATTSRYAQELLFVLYPLLTGTDRLSAATELQSDKSTLSFNGEEVRLRPHSNSIGERPPSVRSVNKDEARKIHPVSIDPNRVEAPRRVSSFVLVDETSAAPSIQLDAKSAMPMVPKSGSITIANSLVEAVLELALDFFIDQICTKQTFQGIGLFLKVPPGFQEHQAYFESYILLHALSQLGNHLRLHQKLFADSRVLGNLSRFAQHVSEAVGEGWFINGVMPLLEFVGEVLEYLQRPEIAVLKSVRLCSQSTNMMRAVFLKGAMWRLSELNEDADEFEVIQFLQKMTYWQPILFTTDHRESTFTRLITYLLYHKLISKHHPTRCAAAQLWRIILVQKPTEVATMLSNTIGHEQRHLSTGFMKLTSMDDVDFLLWIDENREALDAVFFTSLSRAWEEFVQSENRSSEETHRARVSKRKEKLRQWQAEETQLDEVVHRFEVSTGHWRANLHAQERSKLQRSLQDHQENVNQLHGAHAKVEDNIKRAGGIYPQEVHNWQLDATEAVNRMRMRIIADKSGIKPMQPKRKASMRAQSQTPLAINTQIPLLVAEEAVSATPMTPATPMLPNENGTSDKDGTVRDRLDSMSGSQLLEGGFEMVEDPKEDEDGLVEDKNRKIMTSLQRGDMVQQLHNISRIIGLEACEGLLVIGQKCLYLQDNFFQRSDGEIVSVAQAPQDERDPYLQLISGQDVGTQQTKHSIGDQETRHWAWAEVLSISKRRFLFRDVSLEVFFSDGRSYLLTCMSAKSRDEVYAAISQRAPHVHSASAVASEDSWRLDTLRIPEEAPQSIGTRLGGLFNSTPTHTATKKWARGEMSNFQYLMLINTMAGRTFNDLTQYPVFPWVLADYTSDKLDLDDPDTFRDLSKPMGCQTPARQAEFEERYRQFADMGDHNAPPFHYGTHYSSAMIVSSYLIRLQPFVQSYLLLQGGSFDHADRLFDSIEKAWLSASRENRSDVRELIPEFYYLPEFLVNINKYDFGTKQVSSEVVNDVHLPKWANGDPHTFVTKHREALESPYVSQHLHEWIDLVFGHKQRGEAAIEATNVFQHLSYGGAKDLDRIDDHVERLATIGIIHSFGQTPHQIFHKPHPCRELDHPAYRKLDTLAGTLTKLPDAMIEIGEKVADFTYAASQDRLLASGPCKLNVLPNCDRYVQWGFADNSLRFFSTQAKRMLGLYENVHVGQISCATFADSKTLITAGIDCTIGVWKVSAVRDAIDMSSKAYLFGHRSPVVLLAASRVFSLLLSVSTDGQVLLWGLNRYTCIRELLPAGGEPIQAARVSNVSGHILICRGSRALVYTLNGHLLVDQRLCDDSNETMTCCTFYEGVGNEYLERELCFTGHAHGITNVWSLVTLNDGSWCLQLVKKMMTSADPARAAAITAILPMSKAVYTGDEDGNVWDWETVQRQGSGRNGRLR